MTRVSISDLVALRHALHRRPEVGLELPGTQGLVLEALTGLDLEISTGRSCSSVTAVLRGGAATAADPDRPVVLLRADMDALPLTELAAVDFRSETEGVMHGCGHDLHTAMLVGAARLLAARAGDLPGDVIFMFQPGEEGHDGASAMLAEGVLATAGPRPRAAWALHVQSGLLPRGQVSSRPGPLLAASSELTVTVRGAGGHGGAPDRARDPVPAACELVLALQTLLSRTVSPFAPAVLTVGSFQAGATSNVIPETARFAATVRCFDEDVMTRLEHDVIRLCRGLPAAYGLAVDVEFRRNYPVTLNSAAAVTSAAQVVEARLGPGRYQDLPLPIMASEDFSRVLQAVPGAMLFLGACTGDDHLSAPDNHSPFAAFSDEVLAEGAELYADLAVATLAGADA